MIPPCVICRRHTCVDPTFCRAELGHLCHRVDARRATRAHRETVLPADGVAYTLTPTEWLRRHRVELAGAAIVVGLFVAGGLFVGEVTDEARGNTPATFTTPWEGTP